MVRSPQFLSIWDLAYHWHDLPVPIEPGPVPPAVRQLLTGLLEAVLDSEIGVYEPVVFREEGENTAGRTSLHMQQLEDLPSELVDAYVSGVYDAARLAGHRIKTEDVLWWAARNGADDIPDFCIPDHFRPKEVAEGRANRRPEVEDKLQCHEIARRKWAQDSAIRMAEMARSEEIQIQANGRLYQPATLLGWLREVAPEEVRNRRGRPTKRIREEN